MPRPILQEGLMCSETQIDGRRDEMQLGFTENILGSSSMRALC